MILSPILAAGPPVITPSAGVQLVGPALDAETECIAKVVAHEAASQAVTARLAVAEVILKRVQSGRFAPTACAVVRLGDLIFYR